MKIYMETVKCGMNYFEGSRVQKDIKVVFKCCLCWKITRDRLQKRQTCDMVVIGYKKAMKVS